MVSEDYVMNIASILAENPSAVYGNSEIVAPKLMEEYKRAGLEIPQEVQEQQEKRNYAEVIKILGKNAKRQREKEKLPEIIEANSVEVNDALLLEEKASEAFAGNGSFQDNLEIASESFGNKYSSLVRISDTGQENREVQIYSLNGGKSSVYSWNELRDEKPHLWYELNETLPSDENTSEGDSPSADPLEEIDIQRL